MSSLTRNRAPIHKLAPEKSDLRQIVSQGWAVRVETAEVHVNLEAIGFAAATHPCQLEPTFIWNCAGITTCPLQLRVQFGLVRMSHTTDNRCHLQPFSYHVICFAIGSAVDLHDRKLAKLVKQPMINSKQLHWPRGNRRTSGPKGGFQLEIPE